MWVQMLLGARGEGGKQLNKGETYEVSAQVGRRLVNTRRAVEVPAPERSKKKTSGTRKTKASKSAGDSAAKEEG